MSFDDDADRRSFLKAAGSAAAATAIAGCLGGDGDGSGGNGSGDGGNASGGGDDGSGGNESGGGDTETGGGDTETSGDDTETGGGDTETGDGEQASGTLVYARGDHPENYDPQQTTSGEVAKVTNQIFDTLIQFKAGSGGELQAGLASDWSLEGQTATLQLKEGIQFHSGEEFTASDFRATFRRFTDPDYEYYLGDDTRSGYGPFTLGNWIESVDDSNDYELTIELTQEYAPFLRNLAMFAAAVLSKTQIEDLGGDQAALGTEPSTELADLPWYGPGEDWPWQELPTANTAGEVAVAGSLLSRTAERIGVQVASLEAAVVPEDRFNRMVTATRSKAATSFTFVSGHLQSIWQQFGQHHPVVVIDRQSGRSHYRELLQMNFPECHLMVLGESSTGSSYYLAGEQGPADRAMTVHVEVGADERHMPTALASMLSKYSRELLMARLNAYFQARVPSLNPTAGYAQDARRFLAELAPHLPELGVDQARLCRRC